MRKRQTLSLIAFRTVRRVLGLVVRRPGVAVALEEHIYALIPPFARRYCDERADFVGAELAYARTLGQHANNLVVVGGGPVPFTAITAAERTDAALTVIDRSRFALMLSARLAPVLLGERARRIRFVHCEAADYREYEGCVVIVSLFGYGKTQIVDRIMQGSGRRSIFVRVARGESLPPLFPVAHILRHVGGFDTLIIEC